MITRKCLTALITFVISMLLVYVGVQLMSLFPSVSKWLGFGVGTSALVISLALYFRLHKKLKCAKLIAIAINSFATGIAISSLFVLKGEFPELWQSASLLACTVFLFFVFCLLTNITFFRKRPKISLIIYGVLLIAGAILYLVFCYSAISILSGISAIPLTAFLYTLSAEANTAANHFENMAVCSFWSLIIVLIVVFAVLSEGNALDGLSGDISDDGSYRKRNPYEYNYFNYGAE